MRGGVELGETITIRWWDVVAEQSSDRPRASCIAGDSSRPGKFPTGIQTVSYY